MKHLNKRIKQNITIITIIFLFIFSFPQYVFASNDKIVYNRQSAVTYAKNHIEAEEAAGNGETCGLVCDKFVKACLTAGGIDVNHVGDVTPVMKALEEAQLGEILDIVVSEDGKYIRKNDNPWLEAGDIIGFYCNTCGDHSHMALIAGFDEHGNAQAYGHNKTWNLKTNLGTYIHTDGDTGIIHEDGYSIDAVHITNEQFHNHYFDLYDSNGDKAYEKEHPHRYVATCDCGVKYHLSSGLSYVSACVVCNPPLADIPVVSAEVNEENLVSLKWSTVDNVEYYQVYRANTYDGEYSKISSDLNFTSFKNPNTKKNPGRTFYYKVKAVRTNESESVFSDVISITITPGDKFHRYIIDAAVEPTCTEVGYTEGRHCSECNTIFVEQEKIPETGHSFGDAVSNGDGTATMVCTICNYPKTVTEIYRIKGSDRYATSIAIAKATKEEMGVDKFNTIIIASGEGFADALAGSYLAKVKSAPIVMASGRNDAQLKEYVSANLETNGTVYILGGTAAVKQNTEDALKTIPGITVKRLKGSDRYLTNIEILKEAGVTNEDILVATGANFADSLSASAVGKPILLVDGKKSLSAAQKAYLESLSTSNIYILGGTGAVGENYERELSEYGIVERIKGKSRHETSVAIANKFFTNPSSVVIADAWNFPDGLCGGPLAITMNAPLILTKSGDYAAAKGYIQENNIEYGSVLGGTARIDDTTALDIFSAQIVQVKE